MDEIFSINESELGKYAAPHEPIKSTEIPQPTREEVEKSEKDSSKSEHQRAQQQLEKLIVTPAYSGEKSVVENIKNYFHFTTEKQVFEYIVSIITDPKIVSKNDQHMTYPAIKDLIVYKNPNASEHSNLLNLAWYDYHYHEEPSKMLAYLQVQDIIPQKLTKKNLALVLSLLHSGITSDTLEKNVDTAKEILRRREQFRQRIIAGPGVQMIALEDGGGTGLNAQNFTKVSKDLGTELTTVNPTSTSTLTKTFGEAIAKSDPLKPLTIVLTVHGMAQEGGYLALPDNTHLTSTIFAELLKARGNTENVTILTTQCLPRSSRRTDSFMDNFREECLRLQLKVPTIYMESMENQPAIFNPDVKNKEKNMFQTLQFMQQQMQPGQKEFTGADILESMESVAGNQPSLILPNEHTTVHISDDLASVKTIPNLT